MRRHRVKMVLAGATAVWGAAPLAGPAAPGAGGGAPGGALRPAVEVPRLGAAKRGGADPGPPGGGGRARGTPPLDGQAGVPGQRKWALPPFRISPLMYSPAGGPGRRRQTHASFRARSPGQPLTTAAPWTSPWFPPRYMQNFRKAA